MFTTLTLEDDEVGEMVDYEVDEEDGIDPTYAKARQQQGSRCLAL